MMFAYLLIVVVVVTTVLQQSLFPESAFSHIMASNDKDLSPEMRLQLKMSMRTEIIARFTDILTGLTFFYFEVFLSESGENESVVEWSAPGKFCLASFILKSLHYIFFM
jgi:hypothetical protein